MKNLVMPVLVVVPVTIGALWVFGGSSSETVAAVARDAVVEDIAAGDVAAGETLARRASPNGRFVAPVACDDPRACVVQNHVDLRPGPGIADPSCGARTYDDHQGVDFRILDLPTMLGGVPVVAVADGEVIGVRDGEYDGAWLAGGREVVEDRDCGNGIAIRHADGFVTQVCQLRRNSVAVKEGDTVTRGQRIASVGMSGRAEFPHVHLSITKDGARVDPFGGGAIGTKCGGSVEEGLWAGVVPDHWLPSAGPFIFKSGFTDAPVTVAMIERAPADPARDAPSMVFYARAVGLEKGDVERIELIGPEGFEPVGSEGAPMARAQAHTMRFVGRPADGEPLPAGEYRGRYQILRDGEPVLDISRSYTLQ